MVTEVEVEAEVVEEQAAGLEVEVMTTEVVSREVAAVVATLVRAPLNPVSMIFVAFMRREVVDMAMVVGRNQHPTTLSHGQQILSFCLLFSYQLIEMIM